MLVLVSFGLVLLATILLVVGLLTDDGLGLIYLSIACSATAAVVLWIAFRRAKPKKEVATEPPAPLLPEGAEPELVASAAPAAAGERTAVQPAVAEPEADGATVVNPGATPTADTEPAVATEPVATTGADDDWVDDDDWADAGDFEVEFPIADYDELSVDEIMPLLPQLYSDELDVVAERERSGKARTPILAKLAELAATGTEADALEAEVVEPAPEPEPAPAAVPTSPAAPARPAPQVPSLADDWDDDVPFPIADYDELSTDQIIPLLAQLEDDELEDVKAREAAGQGRKSVITEIDRQLGLVDAGDDAWRADEAPAAPAPAPATPEPAAAAPAGRPAPQAEAPTGAVLAIAGYDGLTVAQIRPLLAGLSDDELRAVLEHEVARDNRRTIVTDIERRLASPAAEPATKAAASRAPRKAASRSTSKAATRATSTKKSATAKKAAKRTTKKAAAARFPIDGYDSLPVAKIRPLLAGLDARQLAQVREREVAGAGRKTILAEIDKRLG